MQETYNNPSEFVVELTTTADRIGLSYQLAHEYEGSELKQENDAYIDYHMSDTINVSEETLKELAVQHATVTPWWWGFRTLFVYRTLKNLRTGDFMGPRIGSIFFIALLMLTLYQGIGNEFQ